MAKLQRPRAQEWQESKLNDAVGLHGLKSYCLFCTNTGENLFNRFV